MNNPWLHLSNKLLYAIEGVDTYGRKFTGLYNKEDASYLLAADRLNKVVAIRKSIHYNQPLTTSRLEK